MPADPMSPAVREALDFYRRLCEDPATPPNHSCGPDSHCDAICVSYAQRHDTEKEAEAALIAAVETAQDARRAQMTDEQTVEAAVDSIEWMKLHEVQENGLRAIARAGIVAALPLLTAKLRAQLNDARLTVEAFERWREKIRTLDSAGVRELVMRDADQWRDRISWRKMVSILDALDAAHFALNTKGGNDASL